MVMMLSADIDMSVTSVVKRSITNTAAAPPIPHAPEEHTRWLASWETEEEQSETMERVRPLLTSDVLDIKLGGLPAFSQEITKQVEKDLATAESFTFPILAILLVLIFGSLVAAALPLAIGGVVILGAFLILRFTTEVTDISIFALNIITMNRL